MLKIFTRKDFRADERHLGRDRFNHFLLLIILTAVFFFVETSPIYLSGWTFPFPIFDERHLGRGQFSIAILGQIFFLSWNISFHGMNSSRGSKYDMALKNHLHFFLSHFHFLALFGGIYQNIGIFLPILAPLTFKPPFGLAEVWCRMWSTS